ncbi:putative 1-deoxy-D-xylulose-5-phosphate synthase, chloroplastic [Dorcoceras hygrometricum]|uniref:Putative 1-deoxy-D-xylulose-5-phosphate synthase, chloroplastic n=1 Tax=Dorcoceras hygrometricum TaxID=472368 RepID=A0A2Z7B970_9LAMI|nr:putative 1-deoxy-D-xylulose-5-phosphate synthase, chloroplastic [Dorcoceras hygrometricum]
MPTYLCYAMLRLSKWFTCKFFIPNSSRQESLERQAIQLRCSSHTSLLSTSKTPKVGRSCAIIYQQLTGGGPAPCSSQHNSLKLLQRIIRRTPARSCSLHRSAHSQPSLTTITKHIQIFVKVNTKALIPLIDFRSEKLVSSELLRDICKLFLRYDPKLSELLFAEMNVSCSDLILNFKLNWKCSTDLIRFI